MAGQPKTTAKEKANTASGFKVKLDRLFAEGHRPLAVFSADNGQFAVHGIESKDANSNSLANELFRKKWTVVAKKPSVGNTDLVLVTLRSRRLKPSMALVVWISRRTSWDT